MAAPSMVIRIAANVDELKRNLADGRAQIEALGPSVAKMAATWATNSANLIQNAHNITAAIQQIGASTLTAADAAKNLKTLDAALLQLRASSQPIPPLLQQTADKLRAMGDATKAVEAPMGGMSASLTKVTTLLASFGVSLSVGSVIAFGKAILEDADVLTKMSDRTGIGTEALQRLRAIAEPSGNTIEELAASVNKFQNRLVEGTPDVVNAMTRIGVSITDIKAQAPDEQFLTIARAIKEIQDPAERTRIAMELFGRSGAEILPSLIADVDGLKNSTVVMSREAVKALDDAGDAWVRYWRNAKGIAGNAIGGVLAARASRDEAFANASPTIDEAMARRQMGGLDIPLTALAQPLQSVAPSSVDAVLALARAYNADLTPAETKALHAAIEFQDRLAAVNQKIADATRDVGKLSDANQIAVLSYRALGLSNEEIATKLRVSVVAVGKFVDGIKVMRESLDLVEGSAKQFELKTLALGDALESLGEKIPIIKLNDLLATNMEGVLALWGTKLRELEHDVIGVGDAVTKMGLQIKPTMNDIGQGLTKTKTPVDELGRAFEHLGRQIGGSLGDAVSSLGFFITKFKEAKTTADKIAAEIQAGIAIASGFATPGSRGSNIANYAGQGAALGSAILPGWGTAVGAGVGAVVGALKVPDDEKNARDQFNAFKRATAGMFDTVASGTARLQAGGDAWAKMVQQVTAAYEATGRTGAQAMWDLEQATRHTRDDVEKLPDDLAKLNVALQEAAQDQSDLDAAMTKYKLTLEDMGPAFQKQELTKQALSLENSFRLLVGAGADASVVIDRMGDDINAFIKSALKTGTEVPREMKPMLEQMAAAGKLLDENGNAITDLGLSGITWSETMTQGFDRIVTALDKVLMALGWVDNAIIKIPNEKHINVLYDLPNPPSGAWLGEQQTESVYASMGGRVTAQGIQYFAGGGNVLRFRPRGFDTVPAMLTPGERVLSVAQNRAYESGGGSAGAIVVHEGSVSLVFNIDTIDERGMREAFDTHILPEIHKALVDNRRDCRTDIETIARRVAS